MFMDVIHAAHVHHCENYISICLNNVGARIPRIIFVFEIIVVSQTGRWLKFPVWKYISQLTR